METVLAFLKDQAHRNPAKPAIFNRADAGQWSSVSWSEVWARVIALSGEFKARGLAPGDRLAIIAANSLEWELTHFAALAAGAIVIGLDAHDTSERLSKVMQNASVNALVIGNEKILAKLGGAALEKAKFVVCLVTPSHANVPANLIAWESISHPNQREPGTDLVLPKKDDPATIIYTSGTTGEPKGILYTHGQLALACEAIVATLPTPRADARFICWLPLSNLFQRVMNLCGVASGAALYMVADPLKVMDFVAEIEPDVFIGVPRFYEKLATGIKAKLAAETGAKASIAKSALAIGRRMAEAKKTGRSPSLLLQFQYAIADRLLLRRLRGLLGNRLQYLISGSAPIAVWILELFESFGCPVLEAYGLSENILPIAMNTPSAYRFGTVGKVIAQNEIKIADDGEVLVRGGGLFNGYFGDPGSFERVSTGGFYHTGDFGQFDDEGFLKLTGRKSEIIKTSAGRRIALPAIEAVLRELSWIDHAVVIGSGRKCLAALVTIDPQRGSKNDVANMRDEITAHIRARLSRHEQPAAALVVARPFTIDGGELTPNLKLRRGEIENKYRSGIERLFQGLDRIAQPAESEEFLIEVYE